MVGTDPTHLHLVVSWNDFVKWDYVRDRLKNALSLFIGRLKEQKGGKWFVGNGSRKQVTDQEHFNYLLNVYLPGHRGVFWREGQPLPEIDPKILNPGASALGYEDPDSDKPRKET